MHAGICAGGRPQGRSLPRSYARGVRSSRAIERSCIEDVAYRVIAAHKKPDHATIARFVERHQDALAEVFGGVLGLCAKAGLVAVKVVAVDGSKVSANASREANVDYERLAREILQDARAIDAAEDERFGDRRGDELPPELATSEGVRSGSKPRSAGWTVSAPSRPRRSSATRRRSGGAADPPRSRAQARHPAAQGAALGTRGAGLLHLDDGVGGGSCAGQVARAWCRNAERPRGRLAAGAFGVIGCWSITRT